MTATVVAAVATMLAAVVLVPQIVRLIGGRDVTGVAVTWAALGCVGNTAWVAYLVIADLWLAAIAPAMAVVSYALIVRLLVRTTGIVWLPASIAYGLVLAGIARWAGLPWLAATLVVVPAVQVVPQVVAVYRESSPSGVSPLTWALSVAAALMWMIYGTMIGSLALVGYGLVRGAMSGLVLVGRSMPATVSPTAPDRRSERDDRDLIRAA